MPNRKWREAVLLLALAAALLAPLAPGLGSYATLDEPYWLSMGANFYYALGQREFQNTVYEYQPAVTTMWIVTAALLAYFPAYRGLGQGYLDYNKGLLDGFLLEHGKHPLALLQLSRGIQVFVVAALFLVLYFYLRKFSGKYAAAFAILFAAYDPFFLSQSRMLDHEALLSLFVTISLLALLARFSEGRKFFPLLVSGFAAGLAQLTKSSALAMLAPVGILFLLQIIRERASGWGAAILSNLKTFAIWLGLLAAAYVIFWPGMWVAPGKMLYETYGNAFSYAFQGGRLAVTGELNASKFSLNFNLNGALGLALMLLRRVTPLTWLGILFGFALLSPRKPEEEGRTLFVLFWSSAAAFILMFGIAQGRDSPHYILCSYLSLNLLAGLGWFAVTERFVRRAALQSALALLVLAGQLGSALPRYPYYYTYENPLLQRENAEYPLFPYGEGLEHAARYLAQQPNAKDSTALVYLARGCFSYFYPGKTLRFKNYYANGRHAEELLSALRSSDYLVIYSVMQERFDKYSAFMAALAEAQPLREIRLDGRKYAVIYRVSDLPASVFEKLKNLPVIEEAR